VSDPNLAELEEVFCFVVHKGGSLQDAIACVLRANEETVASISETPEGKVLRAACKHYGIKIGELLRPCREERFTRRRYAAMVAMRLAGVRPVNIARSMEYGDNTTVYYALSKSARRSDIAEDGARIHAMAFALGAERRAA